jgi:hypothetical protein
MRWSCNSSKNLRSDIVAPIILQNLIDDTDASKQSKTSSGETPELGLMMLETTRSSKNLKQTVKNEFRGIPWTGVYDAGNHQKLQKPPLHTGVMVENSQRGSRKARQREDTCKLTTLKSHLDQQNDAKNSATNQGLVRCLVVYNKNCLGPVDLQNDAKTRRGSKRLSQHTNLVR